MNTFINGAPVWSDEQMNELRQQLAERDAEVAELSGHGAEAITT